MSLTILNSVSSLTAENALSTTQANLQKTLNQMSTGLKINSGSDDAAGLSIATGMQANIAALTQSQQNASNGIGMLQTADGALSQVTTLLNRAVTLATEASNGGLTTGGNSQGAALNGEFQSILTEINQIGQTTDFNGQNVFSTTSTSDYMSTQASIATSTAMSSGSLTTITDAGTGGTFVFKASAASKVTDLQAAITAAVTEGTLSAGTEAIVTSGQLEIKNTGSIGESVSTTDAVFGNMNAVTTAGGANSVFIGDGTSNSSSLTQINTASSALTLTTANLNLPVTTTTLATAAGAQAALTLITTAINTISAQRGAIGASVNRLTAANDVMSNAVTNLQSATNNIENADIGQTVANMTQYNVLQSTGMAALQQSNQAQQSVLKLVQ
jgi:flagellin